MITAHEIMMLVVIGLVAGGVGGLLGIGGSIIMIPAMVILFENREWHSQHLFQASAMVVNIAVAVPAAIRHTRAGAMRKDLFRIMLPVTMCFIIVGVLVSDRLDPNVLRMIFAAFLLYVAINNLRKFRDSPHAEGVGERVTWPRGGFVGMVMGFMAGLLGIGGGGIAVPLIQMVCRLPLRNCIAVSASVMCITAGVGAATKIGFLHTHGDDWRLALIIALLLAPTAILGGFLGAGLTHRLPLQWVRGVFIIVLLVTAAKMAGLI